MVSTSLAQLAVMATTAIPTAFDGWNNYMIKNLDKPVGADPWIHRSEGMRCKTCIWFVPKQIIKQGTVGELDPVYHLGRCRRHAPTMGGYPVVFVNDWCGDHRIDENKY